VQPKHALHRGNVFEGTRSESDKVAARKLNEDQRDPHEEEVKPVVFVVES
jgi:hypothetical protein